MATSGSFGGNYVNISGAHGGYIFTNWQLASQDTGGNFSTINWQTYFHFDNSDAQLDNGRTDWNGGALWTSGRDYNYAGNFSTRDLGLASGSFNIGHDGAGNATLNLSNGIDVYSSGHSGGSGSWALPTINRYANIDGGPNFDDVTDEWIRVAWHADRSVDYISWWSSAYDGGGHHDSPASGQGWFYLDLHNLVSGKQYDFTVAIRNAASGLWTQSGTAYATTRQQNNYVGKRVI